MHKFQSLRPVGEIVGTLGLRVKYAGSNPALAHFTVPA